MTVQFRQFPTYDQPVGDKSGTTNRGWYRWFIGTEQGTPPASETNVTLAASPVAFVAPRKGFVLIAGGTVTMIQFSRTTGVNYNTGQIQGMFPVSANDVLTINYSTAPTVTFVPQ